MHLLLPGKVHVENSRFQANYIATTDATMNLDPGDDRAVTGLVRVWGDLQVDGTTTTVNSTELTVDDVTLLLGGDTAPGSDDNLDRGVQFRYYDSQARLGFYGWDTNYTDLGGHEGGYRFLHAATNSSEVFTGTDSGIIAGNVKLTTNTNSTSNTTGDLVVAGGAGIGQDVNIGGLLMLMAPSVLTALLASMITSFCKVHPRPCNLTTVVAQPRLNSNLQLVMQASAV